MTAEKKLQSSLAALTSNDKLQLRAEAAKCLRECLMQVRKEAEAQLLIDGNGTACAECLSRAQDAIVETLYAFASQRFGQVSGMAVVATGGYGRGTLAPGSDIDLLFLLPGPENQPTKDIVEFILYALWDAKQKVGHAVRQVEDCIRLAKTDITILTAILEARFLCGHRAIFDEMTQRFKAEIVATQAKQFVAKKLAERDARHVKHGESRYTVEPDLKDGKGGLRDLHTLFWIAKFLFNANSPGELAEKRAFSQAELKTFLKAEDFLWTVRCHLHFIAGRGEDKLSFDHQQELARRLRYHGTSGLRPVERFMRHYFLIAKDVGDLTRIFCASLEEKHLKDVQGISRILTKFLPKRGKAKLPKAFTLDNGRITVADAGVFAADPVNLLRIFDVAGESLLEIHPDALKLIRHSLRLIDDPLRHNAEANRIFLRVLCECSKPEQLLRLMNEAGVLARFIPEFGQVVALMQFNMYHHFTVDEHLIRAVGILRSIEDGKLKSDHPMTTALFPTLTARRALYVAVLLHDIAKGRGEDHSVGGERIARKLCPRLGLTDDETDLVAWLIRYHLLMSETSQMRDLNDFKTILDFAAVVQSPERLKLLLILTIADICAVGPGVWNGWKGQLLRELYMEAEIVISGGHTASSRSRRVQEAQDVFFAKLDLTDESERKRIAAKHYDAYWLNVPTERQLRNHTLIKNAKPSEVATSVATDARSGITEISVLAPDHPRLLSMVTGACAAAGGNIIGAHIFTTSDGFALDTIILTRAFPEEADEQRRAAHICQTIKRVLHGDIRLSDELARVQQMPERAKAFTVAPRVVLDNASSNKNTVVEVSGLDRVGLLHALTEALFRLNLNINSAHITTFGEKAVDVFYVTDLLGHKIESDSRKNAITNSLLGLWPKAGHNSGTQDSLQRFDVS